MPAMSAPSRSARISVMHSGRREFCWFMIGHGCYFVALGIQGVLFSWLLAILLREPAGRIGLAQMLVNLPLLLLLLFGGAVADRSDCRRMLMRVQILLALPPLALLLVLAAGRIGFP